MEELTKLPGVGRKTANIILGRLYGVVVGIAVDTHVTRLSRLFDFTNRMIAYGRQYCKACCKYKNCPLNRFVVSIPIPYRQGYQAISENKQCYGIWGR